MATNPILDQIIEVLPAPYSARYKPLPAEDKPVGCAIPDLIPGELDLGVVTPITLSDNCQFGFVPTPINVIPFIPPVVDTEIPCADGFAVTMTISSITRAVNVVTVIVEGNHNLSVGDEAKIQGADQPEYNGAHIVTAVLDPVRFQFNVQVVNFQPVSPATGNIRLVSPGGAGFCIMVSGQAVESNAVSFAPEVGPDGFACGLNVGGCVNLELPDVICPNGFQFGGGIGFKINGVPLPPANNTVTLTTRGSLCGGDITGEIDIPLVTWCPEGVNVNGTIQFRSKNTQGQWVPINQPGTNIPQQITLTSPPDSCEINLGGGPIDLDIPNWACPNGISFSGGIKVKIGGVEIPQPNPVIFAQAAGDACHGVLSGDIDLDLPQIMCEDGFKFTGGITVRVRQPGGNYEALDAAHNTVVLREIQPPDSFEGCGGILEGNIDLDIPSISCPNGFRVNNSSPVEMKVNGTNPPRYVPGVGIVRTPSSFQMNQTDECNASLEGNFDFGGLPVFRGPWFIGGAYEMFDMVTVTDEDDLTCSYLALVKNPIAKPDKSQPSDEWATLGCDGSKSTPAGPAGPSKRLPFEVVKVNGNNLMVNPLSMVLEGFRHDKKIRITGLGKEFTLATDQQVWLEIVFDPTSLENNVIAAFIAKGATWDDDIYPQYYKYVTPNTSIGEQAINNAARAKYVEPSNSIDLEIDQALNNLINEPFPDAPRIWKTYVPIGFVNPDGAGDISFNAGGSTLGFSQGARSHFVLMGTTLDFKPAVVALPHPGAKAEVAATVTVAVVTPGPDNYVYRLTVAEGTIWYTNDGSDVAISGVPTETAKSIASGQTVTIPSGGTLKTFATSPSKVSSKVITVTAGQAVP